MTLLSAILTVFCLVGETATLANAPCTLSLGSATASCEAAETPLLLRVKDVKGSYTIPVIQSADAIEPSIEIHDAETCAVRAALLGKDKAGKAEATRDTPRLRFAGLAPGEYMLELTGVDEAGKNLWTRRVGPIGIGYVLAALGDSLTEGYFGAMFHRDDLNLSAEDFPRESVSRDQRNFPRYAPTAHGHTPQFNCFQSWMPRLNDGLTAAWQQPVFIANEGWGGYTTGNYLDMMRGNYAGWGDRMRLLKPSIWLIHLGVNDERHNVSAHAFAHNLRAIVHVLRSDYGAQADAIYIAYPSHDYAPGASAALRGYIARIDEIVDELGLRHGPDFFKAFAMDRAKWYGADPVHPGPEGMDYMADLWLRILAPGVEDERPKR